MPVGLAKLPGILPPNSSCRQHLSTRQRVRSTQKLMLRHAISYCQELMKCRILCVAFSSSLPGSRQHVPAMKTRLTLSSPAFLVLLYSRSAFLSPCQIMKREVSGEYEA